MLGKSFKRDISVRLFHFFLPTCNYKLKKEINGKIGIGCTLRYLHIITFCYRNLLLSAQLSTYLFPIGHSEEIYLLLQGQLLLKREPTWHCTGWCKDFLFLAPEIFSFCVPPFGRWQKQTNKMSKKVALVLKSRNGKHWMSTYSNSTCTYSYWTSLTNRY